jgi:hypothetical protein
MLSDKSGQVRLESLKALSMLYAEPTIQAGLRPFSERFKARIVEMAHYEKEAAGRYEACKNVYLANELGFFEESENDKIVTLIFDDDLKVRDAIAPVVAIVFKDQYEDNMFRELEESNESEDDVARFGPLKSVCAMLVQITKLAEEEQKLMNGNEKSVSYETYPSPIVVNQVLSSDGEKDVNSKELELKDVIDWIMIEDDTIISWISPAQIDGAIISLIKHLEFLKV